MFWRRARKADGDAAGASGAAEDEDDLAKMQRQFGIKTVSDKDVEADFLKLLGDSIHAPGKSGLGLSPRTELALFGAGGHGDSDDEEQKILRQLNLGGDLDAIDADALSGGEEEDDDEDAAVAKRELRGVLGDVHREAKRNASRNDPLATASTAQPQPQQDTNLRERIHAMKLQAVALKRGGNVQDALTVFREVKVLEAQLSAGEGGQEMAMTTTAAVAVVATSSSVVSPPPAVTTGVSYAVQEEEEDDVEVTDADMENPEFLAQLAALGLPATKPAASPLAPEAETVESLQRAIREAKERAVELKRSDRIPEALDEMRKIKALETKLAGFPPPLKPVPTAAPPAVAIPIEAIVEIPDAADDSDVDVTEDDMNDPAFAAELAKMGFDPAEMSGHEEAEEEDKSGHVEPLLSVSVQPPHTTTTHKVQGYKKRYSSVNGDDLIDAFEGEEEDEDDEKEEAEEEEEEEARAQEARSGEQTPPLITVEEDDVKASPVHAPDPDPPASFVVDGQTDPVEGREPSNGASIEQLMVQLDKTKLAAVQHKRQGNIQAALDMMRRVKQIENLIEMKRRQAPELPVVPVISPEELERKRQFGELEALLVQFANDATREAKDQLATNRAKAAEWLARRKEYSALLAVLREKRTILGQAPPPYRIEQLREQVVVEHTDVPLDEVHLRIERIHDLSQADGKDVFVKFNLSFPSTAPHEGKTGAVRIAGGSPCAITSENVFRAKVLRGRGTQRLFEIKKAVFEVWRPGSLLRNPELIARGYQELAPLLTTSEIHTHVVFVGSNRKPVGGDVEISLRVRTPLRDKEYKTLVTEVLHIGEYPPPMITEQPESRPVARSEPPLPTPPPLQQPRPHSQSDAASPAEEPTSGLLPHTKSAPALQAAAATEPSWLEDPHDLDLIVSYDVINDEIQRIEAALPNLHGEQAAELGDRLDSLGFKKQLLEIDMQTGKLTLDMYVARLKQRILDDRTMIKQLMKRGRKPDAARVLQRVKIMEKELQGAEGQEEEGIDGAAAAD